MRTNLELQFGSFRLDAAKRLLLRDGAPVALTPKAFDALVLLIERRDRVVTKHELFSELWPDTAVEEATLSQHIFMLRRALEDSAAGKFESIATVHRRGYRFVAPVTVAESTGSQAESTQAAVHSYPPDIQSSNAYEVRAGWVVLAGVLLTALTAAIALISQAGHRPSPSTAVRLVMLLPPGQQLARLRRGALTISPDGSMVVYAANGRLYRRRLADSMPTAIPGTDLDAAGPFFSDDGAWIGFWAARDSTVKKTRVAGGAPVTLASASNFRGANWFGDQIVFADGGNGVWTVHATGGTPELWIAANQNELLYSPQFLGSHDAVLVTAARVVGNDIVGGDLFVYTHHDRQRKLVVPDTSGGRYATSHQLLYASGTNLLAAPFDIRRLQLAGDPVLIADDAMQPGLFDAGACETLVYVPAPHAMSSDRRLGIIQTDGVEQLLETAPATYTGVRVSPDSRRIAVETTDDGGTIWIMNTKDQSSMRRLTFQGHAKWPVWSPDGRSIAYSFRRDTAAGILVQNADGPATAVRLTTAAPGFEHVPQSWSPDGALLAFTSVRLGVKDAVWTVDTTVGHTVRQVLAVAGSNQMDPRFAPDGRWLAYASEGEAGDSRLQVYVEPWPRTGLKHQVTRDGGQMPTWSRDGRHLFYVQPSGRIVSVAVHSAPSLSFGVPVIHSPEGIVSDEGYDVTADGHFILPLVVDRGDNERLRTAGQINVVMNWWRGPEPNRTVPVVSARP